VFGRQTDRVWSRRHYITVQPHLRASTAAIGACLMIECGRACVDLHSYVPPVAVCACV
jgi:hypothetical protein